VLPANCETRVNFEDEHLNLSVTKVNSKHL